MMQYFSSLRNLAAGSAPSILLVPTVQATKQPTVPPSVNACAWILIDYVSGKVLTEGSADEKPDSASLTRTMTSYVVGQALEAGKINLNDVATVGKDARTIDNSALRGSSVMLLKLGDQVAVSDSGKDIIIQPDNDACIALADYVAGSQESFTSLMDGYAKEPGLTDATFQTMYGLDAVGQFSITRDMALLGKMLIHDVSEEYATHKEKEFTFNKVCQPNRNRLLWNTNLNVDGMKTGTTAGAGYNLMVSTTQGDTRLISVVLGAKIGHTRSNESEKLLTWGFHFFEIATPIKSDVIFVTWRIWSGGKSKVNSDAGEGGSVTTPRGQPRNLRASFTLTEPQSVVPLKKGQIVGTVDFQLNGEFIEQCPLTVMEDVEEGGFFSRIRDFVMMKSHR